MSRRPVCSDVQVLVDVEGKMCREKLVVGEVGLIFF